MFLQFLKCHTFSRSVHAFFVNVHLLFEKCSFNSKIVHVIPNNAYEFRNVYKFKVMFTKYNKCARRQFEIFMNLILTDEWTQNQTKLGRNKGNRPMKRKNKTEERK